jgi:hypothetical protein
VHLSISKIFGLTATKSALSTLLVIVPIVIGIWDSLWLVYKAVLVVFLGIINSYLVYIEYRKPGFRIERMLELMIKSLWGPANSAHYRSNIMLYNPKANQLQIKYHYNMMGAVDRNFELAPTQGCAGRAYSNKKPYWVDIPKSSHEKYLVDSGKVWGSMKSVMSVPIVRNDVVTGVLNVDSDLDMSTAMFDDEKTFIVVNAYSDLISELLENER